jgi:hypothetical protein
MVALYLFLTGMTGALARFSYLVVEILLPDIQLNF